MKILRVSDAVIASLGPRSGGSISPARQFGPGVLSGQTVDMWIYLTAPVLGAVLGGLSYRLFIRAPKTRGPQQRVVSESREEVRLPCMS